MPLGQTSRIPITSWTPWTIWRASRTIKGMNWGVFEDFEGFFWLWSRMTFFEEILIWVRSFLICNKRFKKEIFQPVLWHAVSSSHKIRPSSWPIKVTWLIGVLDLTLVVNCQCQVWFKWDSKQKRMKKYIDIKNKIGCENKPKSSAKFQGIWSSAFCLEDIRLNWPIKAPKWGYLPQG